MKIRGLYADSRLRSSGTDSNFTYQLSSNSEVPENTIAYDGSIHLPNVWTSIDEHNNKSCVLEDASIEKIIRLLICNDSGLELTIHPQTHLNSGKTISDDYAVT